jgi:hypothetical protein
VIASGPKKVPAPPAIADRHQAREPFPASLV